MSDAVMVAGNGISRGRQLQENEGDLVFGRHNLAIPAGNRLERLRGAQADRHSVRINDQYRMTFRWGQGHAYEVRIEDYH